MITLADAITNAFVTLTKLSIPLYVDINGKPALVGSGFFVSKGTSNLLVSAAHVLDQAKKSLLYYYIETGTKRHVTGKLVTNTHSGLRETDKLDLGAVLLDGSHQPPYPQVEKFALPEAMLNRRSIPSATSRYGFVGFPASRSRIRNRPAQVIVQPYAHVGSLASLTQYQAERLDPSTHLCLNFNKKKSYDLLGNGRSFPKPHGISGSPIFHLFDEGDPEQAESFLLAGVVTTWLPSSNLVFGAGIRAVIELLDVTA